ncbi:hypothetical protein R3P38DRAFT_184729 [Favolaschia claudopus]|uniref:Uncharacterized protein n=1 Tax=Favolaschia claudopus TaxID=2862362 RepID=A0AAW0D2M6_9AGAR
MHRDATNSVPLHRARYFLQARHVGFLSDTLVIISISTATAVVFLFSSAHHATRVPAAQNPASHPEAPPLARGSPFPILHLSHTLPHMRKPSAQNHPPASRQLWRVFFRPHPHLLLAFTARQLADWAITSHDNRFLLETAIQGGVETLLQLAIEVAELSMDDIRRIYAYKSDVLNPLDRRLDLSAGPASQDNDFLTVCNDPETALLNWIIYGELFHHSHELSYLPLPNTSRSAASRASNGSCTASPTSIASTTHKFEGAHAPHQPINHWIRRG